MFIMDEQGVKEPSRKRLVTLACGDLVILVSKKHISSLYFQQWQPLFFASCNGGRGLPGRNLGPRVLPLWLLDRKFANSIELTLGTISGVGPKTVACVLMFHMNMSVMPVDIHVHRVSRRLGLIGPKVSADQAHIIFAKITPPEWIYPLHVNLIRHGRQICHAQRPSCGECTLYQECAYVGSVNVQEVAIQG